MLFKSTCREDNRLPFASLADGYDSQELASVLNTLDWTNEQIQGLQKVVTDATQYALCIYTEDYAQEVSYITNNIVYIILL